MKFKVLWIAGLMLAATAGQVQAGFIYNDSTFSGSEQLINFDADLYGNPLSISGVTFTSTTPYALDTSNNWGYYFSNISGASLGDALNDYVGQSDITINFGANSVNRAGMLLSTGPGTTYFIQVYDTFYSLLGSASVTMPGFSQAVFVGFESTQNIGSMRVYETTDNGNIMLLDDLRYESTSAVPEPASIAMWGLGALGMAFARRKRRQMIMAV